MTAPFPRDETFEKALPGGPFHICERICTLPNWRAEAPTKALSLGIIGGNDTEGKVPCACDEIRRWKRRNIFHPPRRRFFIPGLISRREPATNTSLLAGRGGSPCYHAVGARSGSPGCLTRPHQGHGSRSEASIFCGLSWLMVQFRSKTRHRESLLPAWSTRFRPMP